MNFGSLSQRRALWSSALYFTPALELPPTTSPDLLLRVRPWLRSPGAPHTLADPYVFAHDGRLYLFYESQVADDFGEIWVAEIAAGQVRARRPILREPFHLSYPCVFAHDGAVYLMPEAQGSGTLRLYRFDPFPERPVLVRTLLAGKFADPSPACIDGIWYIFVTTDAGLELHFTDDLLGGDLQRHPASPITTDPRFSRCGGMPFRYRDQLVRPAQNCAGRYGANLSLLTIDTITPSAYAETPLVVDMLPTDRSWNRDGGHHLSVCSFGGGQVIAIDGQARDTFLHKILGRVWMALTGRARR